jgi:hypothetical protein
MSFILISKLTTHNYDLGRELYFLSPQLTVFTRLFT